MDITAIASPETSNAAKSDKKLAKDIESFLTLLTTQLKHQDPLEPVKSTEFTSQLAQFASVEQSIQTNANLEQLIGVNAGNQALSAVGYIGHSVVAENNTATLKNGAAHFAYELPRNAGATAIAITNEAGAPVFATSGETTAGRHDFVWNGKNPQGVALPEGKYRIAVTAATTEGEPVAVKTFTVGVVDGVDNSEGEVNLTIDGVPVSLNRVVSVSKPAGA